MHCEIKRCGITGLALLLIMLIGAACSDAKIVNSSEQDQSDGNMLSLPTVRPVQLGERPLQVIATTSIIGDVVANVGGSDIELKTLMDLGQDPHSFEPGAAELTAVATADVIFVNGWDLEEGLADDLATISGTTPVVAVGANIDPLTDGDGERISEGDSHVSHDHSHADPHTWFSVPNVQQWVENITLILSDLDPDNKASYEENARAYLLELEDLDTYHREQIATIPVEKRILVTNHGVFNYFAQEYGMQIVGTVIPSTSTQAEPSAGDLAQLVKDMELVGACTIFTGVFASDDLAKTVAQEMSDCDKVKIVPLYTGSLGPNGSGADSYTSMIKVNLDRIVEGLQ